MHELNKIRADIISNVFEGAICYEGTGEVFVFCPNGCHEKKRKLQINVNKGVGQCWVCGLKGTALQLVSQYGTKNDRAQYLSTISFSEDRKIFDIEQTQSISLPKEFCDLNQSKSPLAYPAKKYLKKYGIDKKHIDRFRIGICDSGEFRNRIVFPSFGENGKINCFNTRSIFDDLNIKYIFSGVVRSVVFNELFVDWSKPIILVENVKAHIRHFDIGNVIPILGKKMNADYTLFKSIVNNSVSQVFIALDPDEIEKSILYKKLFEDYGIQTKICKLSNQPDELESKVFESEIFESEEIEDVDPLIYKIKGIQK